MNRTICIDKHEMVVDRDYVEDLENINAELLEVCEDIYGTLEEIGFENCGINPEILLKLEQAINKAERK